MVLPVHLSHSLLSHVQDAAYCGAPQDHRDLSHEVGQIWDYEGYLILIIALDSIYLNPYDDVANRLGKVFPRPVQTTHLPMRSERGPMSREWFSMKPGIMVLIWVLLSKRAMHLSQLTLTLATFSIPYHQLKGLGFKKGVLCLTFYALGVLSWGTFGGVALVWGAQTPFFGAIPSSV